MKRRRIILMVAAIGTLCFLLLAFGLYREITRVEIGQSIRSVAWLPQTASRIFYYRSYPRTAYEFDITEEGFVSHSNSQGWDLKQINGKSVEIPRYAWCINPSSPGVEKNPTGFDTSAFARVSKGYSFEKRLHNGGIIQVAYDTNAKRAYVFSTPR